MRVTNKMMADQTLRNLNTTTSAMQRIQDQVSSGKSLRSPSDNPADVRSAIKARESLDEISQYLRNIDAGTNLTAGADTALSDATDVLQRARELAVEGSNGSLSATDLQAIAKEVAQLMEQLVTDAATRVGDRYIFSGHRTDAAPFQSTGPGTVGAYQGDAGPIYTRVGPGQQVQVNLAGDTVFTQAFTAMSQLYTELNAGTQVSGATLTSLDTGRDVLIDNRATIGARQNRLEQTQTSLKDNEIAATSLLSNLEDVDMAAAISELSQRQLTYNAALKVTGAMLQNSLIDVLR